MVTGYSLDLGLEAYLDDLMGLDPARAARHHIFLVDCCQLIADDLLDVVFARENLLKLGNLTLELGDVLGAVEDVLLVDVAELKFGNKLGRVSSMSKPFIRLGTTSASSLVPRMMAMALSMSSKIASRPCSRCRRSDFCPGHS